MEGYSYWLGSPYEENDTGEPVLKLEIEWSANKGKMANGNSKALNAIFNAIDVNQFKLILTCETIKQAW